MDRPLLSFTHIYYIWSTHSINTSHESILLHTHWPTLSTHTISTLNQHTPSTPLFLSTWPFIPADWNGNSVMRKMDHLVCFMPGALALGAHTDPKGKDSPRAKRDMAVAKVRPFCCYSSCFLFCFSSCYSFRCASCYSFLVTLRVSHVVYPLYPSISLLPTSQQFFQISAKTNHPYLTHPFLTHPYHLSYLNFPLSNTSYHTHFRR